MQYSKVWILKYSSHYIAFFWLSGVLSYPNAELISSSISPMRIYSTYTMQLNCQWYPHCNETTFIWIRMHIIHMYVSHLSNTKFLLSLFSGECYYIYNQRIRCGRRLSTLHFLTMILSAQDYNPPVRTPCQMVDSSASKFPMVSWFSCWAEDREVTGSNPACCPIENPKKLTDLHVTYHAVLLVLQCMYI